MKRLLTLFLALSAIAADGQVRFLTTPDTLTLLTTRYKQRQDNLFFVLGLAGKAPISHTHSASDITSGILPVSRGGTGTASPGLIAGTNVIITGTWPNQTINSTGGGSYTLPVATGSVLGGVKIGSGLSIDGTGVLSTNGGSNAPPGTLVYVTTLGGQSNNLGVGPSDSLYFSPFNTNPDSLTSATLLNRVRIYDRFTNTLQPLVIGVNNQASSDNRYTFGNVTVGVRTFGPELGIAYRFISQVVGNSILVIVKESRDGQAIATFQEGHANGWYAGMLARRRSVDSLITAAGWYQIPGQRHFVWTQGEADGGATQSYYEAQLDTLITHLKADSVIDGRVVIGNISSTSAQYGAGPDAAKVHWVNTHSGAYLINYPDGAGYFNSDLVHMNHKGQLQYGYDAFWKAFATNRVLTSGYTVSSGGGSSSGFPSGSVAYWKLDETSGNFNSTVGTYPLTRQNGVATSAGKISNAADFTASSTQYLQGSTSSAFSPTSSGFTIAGWVNVGSGTIENIVSKAGGTSTNEYGLYADNGSNLLHCYYSSSGSGGTDFAVAMSMGTWQFFTLVFDGSSQLKLSVNAGTPVTSSVSSIYNGTGAFLIGQNPIFSGYPMQGKIDEVGVWNRALTSTEITNLYNSGSGLTHP